jgi:hypothetical protein
MNRGTGADADSRNSGPCWLGLHAPISFVKSAVVYPESAELSQHQQRRDGEP